MTLLEYTLLATNIIGMATIYGLYRTCKNLAKEYKEYLLESILFLEDTLHNLGKLQAALDDAKEKEVIKPKARKNEKKAITK